MSSFTVNGSTAVFDMLSSSYSDKAGPLEEITADVLIADPTTWGALFSLRSWMVSQRPVPGGNNVVVDIGGGAGEGYLTLDNGFDSHGAVLTDLQAHTVEPGSLRRIARATFLITS